MINRKISWFNRIQKNNQREILLSLRKSFSFCVVVLTLFGFTLQTVYAGGGQSRIREEGRVEQNQDRPINSGRTSPISPPEDETSPLLAAVSSQTLPQFDGDIQLSVFQERLKTTETTWRHVVRFCYLSNILDRVLYPIFLRQSDFVKGEEEREERQEHDQAALSLTSPVVSNSLVWVFGESVPIHNTKALRKVYALNAFLEGCETILMDGIELTFLILLVTQIYYAASENQDSIDIIGLLSPLSPTEENSIRDIYNISTNVPHAEYIYSICGLPVLWGVYQGVHAYIKTSLQNSDEKFEKALDVLRKTTPSFANDFMRWSFPFYKVKDAMEELLQTLLWDGRSSEQTISQAFGELEIFSRMHSSISRVNALSIFAKIAHGVSHRNLERLDLQSQKDILVRKAQSLSLLEQEALGLKKKVWSKRFLREGIPALYSSYYLWELGQCRSLSEYALWSVARLAKSVLTVLLFKVIIEGILDILNCPQQQGQTWTGPAAWSSDYTYECFQAYMNAFNNPVPGQPLETLTSLFPKFHLPSQIDMDLSGKSLNGTIISEILNAFIQSHPNVQLQVLNLSNNGIGTVSSSGTVALAKTLCYFPFLQSLDLSHNNIGYIDSYGIVALAESLHSMPQLRSLDLSHNQIGSTDSNGTVVLGESFSSLTQLQSLDLSSNSIVKWGCGIVAFGDNFRYLTQLESLDLSSNMIGDSDYNCSCTVALAENLRYLMQLRSLDLSNNDLSLSFSNGVVALAEILPSLTQLEYLDLSNNYISTITLVKNLHYLKQLQVLDLSNNAIGWTGSNGTLALAENLPFLSQLRSLKLSNNGIAPSDEGILSTLLSSLLSLKDISTLFIVGQTYGAHGGFPYNFSLALQHNFNLSPSQTDIYLIQSADAMASYLSSLPSTLQHLDLSNRFTSTDSILDVIVQNFANFSSLLSLNLSNNNIDYTNSNGTVALSESLRFLKQLQVLDLSSNYIGQTGSSGTVALAESLPSLTQLQVLDLSNNDIGNWDSNGVVALAENLPSLKQLQLLDLSNNQIGDGIGMLAESFRSLTQLQLLDLANNLIPEWDYNAVVVFGENLHYLKNLQVLDLSNNLIGGWGSDGTIALAESLPSLTQLEVLDLSNNHIGYTDSNGTVALAESLSFLRQLESLDLSNNLIGTTDSKGISALMLALAQLTQHSLTTLSLAGIQNIIWTQAANDLEVLINRQLQSFCESQLCHGGSVSQPTIPHRTRSLVSSDQILSEHSSSSQKKSPQSEQQTPPIHEESIVTSAASSPKPPQLLSMIPHFLQSISNSLFHWWKSSPKLALSSQESFETSSFYSFNFKSSSQKSTSSAPKQEPKLRFFNACSAPEPVLKTFNRCERNFNACCEIEPTPIPVAPIESMFLLGTFFWKTFITPQPQEKKAIDWVVPFSERLKKHIYDKLDRIESILQTRSSKSKRSREILKPYMWSFEDLNILFEKHSHQSTIFLSELMDFQDELDYLLLDLTQTERTSEKNALEKQFYDGILERYKEIKALPPLLTILQENMSQEVFEAHEREFQDFVRILFNFEMSGKHKKSNKWMKKFKKKVHRFTSEIETLTKTI